MIEEGTPASLHDISLPAMVDTGRRSLQIESQHFQASRSISARVSGLRTASFEFGRLSTTYFCAKRHEHSGCT